MSLRSRSRSSTHFIDNPVLEYIHVFLFLNWFRKRKRERERERERVWRLYCLLRKFDMFLAMHPHRTLDTSHASLLGLFGALKTMQTNTGSRPTYKTSHAKFSFFAPWCERKIRYPNSHCGGAKFAAMDALNARKNGAIFLLGLRTSHAKFGSMDSPLYLSFLQVRLQRWTFCRGRFLPARTTVVRCSMNVALRITKNGGDEKSVISRQPDFLILCILTRSLRADK